MDGFVSGGSLRTSGEIPEDRPVEGDEGLSMDEDAPAARDGKKLSFDDTPRDASSRFC
jgi:hypothetical protein